MPEISKITLPSGTTYDIKDATARAAQAGAIVIKGTTTTALTDEATTNPITIDGASYTAKANDAVFYSKKEFVFDGTKWHEFGDMSGLGALATKDSASGTVAVPKTYSFTGTAGNVSVTGTTTGSVSETKSAVTVSKAASGTATYTPQGSVSAPTISVATAGSTTSVTGIDSVGSLPSATMPTYTVSNEVLTITGGSFSAGSLPTKATAVTVKTGDASYSASAPTFTGTGARLVTDSQVLTGASFTGASMTSTGSFTPNGSVATATTENKTVTVS